MPKVFLSPSTQEWNKYINGGTEEEYMNLIADAMEPYLLSSGIEFTRNDPARNVTGAIYDSNAGEYDVHFAIHSNAAGAGKEGSVRGVEIYYSPFSDFSRILATIIANNMKFIYPIPQNVSIIPTTSLAEVTQTRAVAVLCEIGYHDNISDADWIKGNIQSIARVLSQSLCDYFGIPLIEPAEIKTGVVTSGGSNLNIRKFPSINAKVIGTIPDGSTVIVYGKTGNWYVIKYDNIIGYSSADFIIIKN